MLSSWWRLFAAALLLDLHAAILGAAFVAAVIGDRNLQTVSVRRQANRPECPSHEATRCRPDLQYKAASLSMAADRDARLPIACAPHFLYLFQSIPTDVLP